MSLFSHNLVIFCAFLINGCMFRLYNSSSSFDICIPSTQIGFSDQISFLFE